jgi:hypothetical protein
MSWFAWAVTHGRRGLAALQEEPLSLARKLIAVATLHVTGLHAMSREREQPDRAGFDIGPLPMGVQHCLGGSIDRVCSLPAL